MMYKTGPLLPNTVQEWALGPTIDEMLQSPSGAADKTSRTLVKGKDMTVVLTVLPKGQGLKEHQAPASLMVIVLRGEVVFDCEGDLSTLVAGERGVLAIGKNQPHAVQALSESAFLLVMGTLDHSSHS